MRWMLAVLLVALAASRPAWAGSVFADGDVMVSVGSNVEQWRDVGGVWTKLDTLPTGDSLSFQSAFDGSGNMYVAKYFGHGVVEFAGPGLPHTSSSFASVTTGGNSTTSIVFDFAGNLYVSNAGGAGNTPGNIVKFDANGNYLTEFSIASDARTFGSQWIDVAADQRTIYYTDWNHAIRRYDVSTGTQLTDLAGAAVLNGNPWSAEALRILGDGSVLVANRQDVRLVGADGSLLRTYSTSGAGLFYGLDLDPDGLTFWTGTLSSQLYRFDIQTGALVDSFTTSSPSFRSVSVVGGGSLGSKHTVTAVPLPSAAWSGLSLLGVLGVLLRARRRVAAGTRPADPAALYFGRL